MSRRSRELMTMYSKEQLAGTVALQELSIAALQSKLNFYKRRSVTRIGKIRKLQARVADLLNQNHKLEDRLRPYGLSSGGILSSRNHQTWGDGD